MKMQTACGKQTANQDRILDKLRKNIINGSHLERWMKLFVLNAIIMKPSTALRMYHLSQFQASSEILWRVGLERLPRDL